MDRRWLALVVLCLAGLMVVLDTTIVNVALPSIRQDLGFGEGALAWVVNAYALTFAGFLLLGGRLGDLFGPRRLFLGGIVLFTLASLACGLARSQATLVAARAVQGVGGAVASAVALALLLELFPEPRERAKAMGVYGFVGAGGGALGVLLGGLLTSALNWHWVFLVNIPVGVAVVALSLALVAPGASRGKVEHLDVAGAVVVTGALMLMVYGIVNAAWPFLAAGVVGLVAFLAIESRAAEPLVPLRLFRMRRLATANLVGVLWSAAMFAWFFLSALYLQLVLGYAPLQVGLSFLAANVIMAAFSLGLSARVVERFGLRRPLLVGMLLITAGLALFARAPVGGTYVVDVLPGMVLLGLGAGIAFNPVLLSAMSDVPLEDSGLASGVANTSFMMGGALGLAVLASLAASRTASLLAGGAAHAEALAGGYRVAFLVGAAFGLGAVVLAATLPPDPESPPAEAVAVPAP